MKKTRIIDVLIVFITTVVIIKFVNPELSRSMGITGLIVTELLLAMIAIAAVLIRKENVRKELSLSLPSIGNFFGAVVLLMGANAWQNGAVSIFVSITGYTSDTDTAALEVLSEIASPSVILITLALMPAICEEILFRGYILGKLKTKKSVIPAILISSVLFAGIHFDLFKLVPLIIMGAAYAYIAVKTSSILIPVIFHFINNALGVISFYTEKNAPHTIDATVELAPESYLGFGIAAFGVGLVLIYFGIRFLSGKPKKKRTTLITLISAGVIATLGILTLIVNLMYTPYNGQYTDRIREDTVYTETFTLTNEAYALVDANIMAGFGVDCNITISDSMGNTVYEYTNLSGEIITLYPDEYTVTYSFDVSDGNTVAHDVSAVVKVNCLSLASSPDEEKESDTDIENTEDTLSDETGEAETEDISETEEADTKEPAETEETDAKEPAETEEADTKELNNNEQGELI